MRELSTDRLLKDVGLMPPSKEELEVQLCAMRDTVAEAWSQLQIIRITEWVQANLMTRQTAAELMRKIDGGRALICALGVRPADVVKDIRYA
jgi:hypothetical protein